MTSFHVPVHILEEKMRRWKNIGETLVCTVVQVRYSGYFLTLYVKGYPLFSVVPHHILPIRINIVSYPLVEGVHTP